MKPFELKLTRTQKNELESGIIDPRVDMNENPKREDKELANLVRKGGTLKLNIKQLNTLIDWVHDLLDRDAGPSSRKVAKALQKKIDTYVATYLPDRGPIVWSSISPDTIKEGVTMKNHDTIEEGIKSWFKGLKKKFNDVLYNRHYKNNPKEWEEFLSKVEKIVSEEMPKKYAKDRRKIEILLRHAKRYVKDGDYAQARKIVANLEEFMFSRENMKKFREGLRESLSYLTEDEDDGTGKYKVYYGDGEVDYFETREDAEAYATKKGGKVEIEEKRKLTPAQRKAKKDYKDSQDGGMFGGDKGKDPLTYGKNIYMKGKKATKGKYKGKVVRDPKRTSASRATKGSGYKKASKSDTNRVKDSIRQSRGQGTNPFAPHHQKKKPNLPKDRKRRNESTEFSDRIKVINEHINKSKSE